MIALWILRSCLSLLFTLNTDLIKAIKRYIYISWSQFSVFYLYLDPLDFEWKLVLEWPYIICFIGNLFYWHQNDWHKRKTILWIFLFCFCLPGQQKYQRALTHKMQIYLLNEDNNSIIAVFIFLVILCFKMSKRPLGSNGRKKRALQFFAILSRTNNVGYNVKICLCIDTGYLTPRCFNILIMLDQTFLTLHPDPRRRNAWCNLINNKVILNQLQFTIWLCETSIKTSLLSITF